MSDTQNREVSTLGQWETPELRRLDALAAELAPVPNPDGATQS